MLLFCRNSILSTPFQFLDFRVSFHEPNTINSQLSLLQAHAAANSPRQHRATPGSPMQPQAAPCSSNQLQAAPSIPQANPGSPRRPQAAPSISKHHHAIFGSPKQSEAAPYSHKQVSSMPFWVTAIYVMGYLGGWDLFKKRRVQLTRR